MNQELDERDCATPEHREGLPDAISRNVKAKTELNQWDKVDDFLKVLLLARTQKWFWWKNSRCKYVELRVDMRDGGCVIRDREGKRINPSELAFQYSSSEAGEGTESKEAGAGTTEETP